MSDDGLMFVYVDSRGDISSRAVVRVSESDGYIQGICLMSNAFRTFRKDRVLEYVEAVDQLQDRLEYWQSPENAEAVDQAAVRGGHGVGTPHAKRGIEICFTGFKAADKERLTKSAQIAGMIVRTSVATALDFLCCGYNAGPKKIEKARHQGVVTLSEDQFLTLVETGEIPENGLDLQT